MANNPIGSEKYEEAKAKVDALKQSMIDLANQVVLDMFQATIAVGGVTEAEANAYFDMAVDMEIISRDAANAAKKAYGNAVDTINEYEINEKTGNVVFEFDSSGPDNYQPVDKKAKVEMMLDKTAIDEWNPPTKFGTITYLPSNAQFQAVGGAVQGGAPYTWQEYGYRGELFVPSADGFIMSRADAERALSKALTGANSGDGIDADAVGKAVANAIARAGGAQGGNVYNLTMPTSSNPADVRTAFELMEAWA
jgi:hypothetical protein